MKFTYLFKIVTTLYFMGVGALALAVFLSAPIPSLGFIPLGIGFLLYALLLVAAYTD